MPLVPGARKQISIGGAIFFDFANLIVLWGYNTSATNCTFRKSFTGSGYAPSGVTYRILAVRHISDTAGPQGFKLLYADNDVGQATGTAYTNAVYLSGNNSSASTFFTENTPSGGAREMSYNAVIPDGKYPAQSTNSGFVLNSQLFGYEE